MPLQFKKCAFDDLEALIQIAKKTFVDAFEKDNNPIDFKAYTDVAFDKAKIKSELENENSSFYFGYEDGSLVGYFKLNTNDTQTEIKKIETIELERIYILQEFQGNKLGQQLLHEAIRIASTANKKCIWLGVWEHNYDAIRFYQKHGFEKFGTHPYFVGTDEQTDWLMRLYLK